MAKFGVSGYDHKDKINKFFGDSTRDPFNAGASCPRCGASLTWNWMHAGLLLLHIDWHERIEMALGIDSTKPLTLEDEEVE